MAPPTASSRRARAVGTGRALALAGCALYAARGFCGLTTPTPSPAVHRAKALRSAEGDSKYLRADEEEIILELSPDEYDSALQTEIEAQRKKYYIKGVVKPGNLVVPWREINEKELENDARKQLKKSGIVDPRVKESEEAETAAETSDINLKIEGGTDVQISWDGGKPKTKVGYIIEKKRPGSSEFREIDSYDSFSSLLASSVEGEQYLYEDRLCPPGAMDYRVLCRYRSGEVKVVGEGQITVPEPEGPSDAVAFTVFGVIAGLLLAAGITLDPPVD